MKPPQYEYLAQGTRILFIAVFVVLIIVLLFILFLISFNIFESRFLIIASFYHQSDFSQTTSFYISTFEMGNMTSLPVSDMIIPPFILTLPQKVPQSEGREMPMPPSPYISIEVNFPFTMCHFHFLYHSSTCA